MTTTTLRSTVLWLLPTSAVCIGGAAEVGNRQDSPTAEAPAPEEERALQIQYLEIVTPEVEATCSALEKLHGVTFGEPEVGLGYARTAAQENGGWIGVRAPMRSDESSVVRPYVLVDDIESAIEAARAAGAEIALPATEIPERGRCAIYIQGGIQHGLWQL